MISTFRKYHPSIIVLIRLFLGLIFFTAGMSKLYFEHQFPGIIGPVWLEERLAEHDLGMYARFIAGSQIIAGLLLFTQRFATLGAILCFPIILNILMVTVSMKWSGTPYVNAFLLLLNAWLLAFDYHKLKFILTDSFSEVRKAPIVRKSLKADRYWTLAVLVIICSVPVSYVNLQLAWALSITGVIGVVVNQLISKRIKNDDIQETYTNPDRL
ncbi:hypothetical protein [Roseivirga sp. E12]|uniref:hypothetical protein n=1 Tax=Roseivirga sp. E12 TaxID=2819237 RepID=UPI001ABC585C|nr:hypothetical protein [Roseivirga sp. E12]MBO3700529.1 hypothetical protein [Roseivirga sp. E12]